MEKDIYTILEEKLRHAGFCISKDFVLEKNESMIQAAKYALCDRCILKVGQSVGHTSKEANNLKITPDELETLLAIVKEDVEIVTVQTLVQKYKRSSMALESWCSELTGMGFLDCVSDTPSGVAGYRVTNRGLMCLMSSEPMDDLVMDPFLRVLPEDLSSTKASNAVPLRNHPTSDFEDVWDYPPSDAEDELDKFHDSEYISKITIIKGDDAPFLDFLNEKMDAVCNGRLTIPHFVILAKSCLEYPQNKHFQESFASIGFEKMPDEQKTFLLLLCDYFTKKGATPMNFSSSSSSVEMLATVRNDLMSASQALVSAGIAVMPPSDTYTNSSDEIVKERYMLSPEVAGTVFHGMTQFINYATLCRQADVWRCESIEPKALLFDSDMSAQVDCLKRLVDPSLSSILMERLREVGRKSLTCIFYGASGAGKTELCRQLARATGRDCIVADPAKISGSYWGDSEKNTREIFRAYRYLQKISINAPILVFNEADGIIGKRFTEVNRATEKSENAVQTIILQELETFEGILIATTNLQNNLDVAADRRFLYKLHFDYPSPEIRRQILTMKMKWVSDEDAAVLAQEFCLSGGQIDNVASKCVIEKFMTGKEASLERMRSFCREEISMRGAGLCQKPRIGFVRYPDRNS